MKQAIEHKTGLKNKQAKNIATFIMDTFGYENRIIDNVLNTDKRQIFYMLEGEGLLTTTREQTRLYDGRAWMTHYWQLNTAAIRYYSKQNTSNSVKKSLKKRKIIKNPSTIYNTLSEEKWLTRKILNREPISSF
jgi:transcription initiation factor IIE alpha subunit